MGRSRIPVEERVSVSELIGHKIGKLTPIKFLDHLRTVSQNKRILVAECDCGNHTQVIGVEFARGEKTSCGKCRSQINPPLEQGVTVLIRPDRVKQYCQPTPYCYKTITNNYWTKVRYTAAKRGYDFLLTPEQVWEIYILQNRRCALSNQDIFFNSETGEKASIDRIDSTKGYTKDNIQLVTIPINFMKQSYSQEYFIEMCKLVASNNS